MLANGNINVDVTDGVVNLKVVTTNQDGAVVLSGYAAARVE